MTERALAAFLRQPRTVRDVCDRFTVAKATAARWIAVLGRSHVVREAVADRQGKRGPVARSYQVVGERELAKRGSNGT